MSGGMASVIIAEVAFQFDCGFPLSLLVYEAAVRDAVNVVRFEFRRLIKRRYLLNCSIVILFV
jgi:hypothetical protein